MVKKFSRSAVVEVDKLRAMIIGGYVKPWPYTEEVDLQLSLSASNACDVANNLLEKGFNVFIDDVVGKKLLGQYSEYFKNVKFKTILLLPSTESLLKRFDDRGDNQELRQRTIDLSDKFSKTKNEMDWIVIDSSNQTLDETVEEIYNLLI